MEKKKEERVPIPLRMPSELYKKVSDIVHFEKGKNRGYSINKFVIEAIKEKVNECNGSEYYGKK